MDASKRVVEHIGGDLSGNYKTIQRKADELKLDTSHMHHRGWRSGTKIPIKAAQPLEEILTKDSHYQSSKLRKRLIEEWKLPSFCMICKNTEWLGQPISLELDHINGINTDNELANLRILCPNCHAQTSTYRGKNKRAVGGIGRHKGLKTPRA
jgi:hypothetical protein